MISSGERKGRTIGLKYMVIWRDTPCTCYNYTTKYTSWPPKQESISG